jgi:NitT/TauT family transport system substrate-binding protein
MTFRPWRWRRSPWFTLPATAAGLIASLGCQRGPQTIAVPIANWPGYEYVYLAQQLGLDRRHGLAIETPEYPDPQEIVHAYLRGDRPIAQLTTVEAVDLCFRVPERCPVIVLVLDESLGGDQLAVRNDIASIPALRGKSVAATYSTLGPYVIDRALEQHGLDISDVTVRNMPLERMASALANGEVAAAALFPPYSEKASRTGRSRVLFTSRSIPGEIFDVLVADPAYLRQHGEAMVQLLRSWQDAHQAATQNPGQAIAIMARRQGLSSAEFKRAEEGLRYYTLEQQQRMLQPAGLIAQNLRRVQRVQQHLQLSQPGALLPSINAIYAKQAMQRP